MRVATWNVLHRIHAENWDEAPVLARFPDEAARIAAIAARIAALDADVICLQEVSGDQLAALGDGVVSHRYPRVPRLKSGARSPLRDPTEHLAIVVRGTVERTVSATFPDDPGKGLLAVHVGGIWIVDVHVTFGERAAGQLARAAAIARAAPGAAVICGDCNADRDAVAAGLGDGFELAIPPPGSPPTRPRAGGGKAQVIDHVALWRAEASDVAVIDVAGESDHNLVTATIRTR